MSKIKLWWKTHDGWIGLILVSAGMLAIGWMLATIHAEKRMDAMRRMQSDDIARLAQSYALSLADKDRVIKQLALKTTEAAQTAKRAAVTADHAARNDPASNPKLKRWTK